MSAFEQVASRDGTPIAFRRTGAGPPILLVHGAATWSADWAFVARALRERFTVVSMDRRGRGRSGDAPAYAVEREAEDVLAVLDAVGAQMLVGHSFGALCSVLAAGRTDRLRRLVLYEPPIGVTHEQAEAAERLVAEGQRQTALEQFLLFAGAREHELRAIRASPAWTELLEAVGALPRELRACAEWRHPAGPVRVPTLLLLGADTDGSVYLDGLAHLEAAFAEIRRATVAGQTHMAHVFAARAFADLVAAFCAGQPEPA